MLPSQARKSKLQGQPEDYIDFNFYQVVEGKNGKRWILDLGYCYEMSPGLYGFVQYFGLWLDPVSIRKDGWEYYESKRDGASKKVYELDSKGLMKLIESIAPGAMYFSMMDVHNDTALGSYYMAVRDMQEQAYAECAAEYERYGYSDVVNEDVLSYLDDARMDEVEDSHAYKLNGRVANRLMTEKMWDDQKMFSDYQKKGLLARIRKRFNRLTNKG